MVCSMLKQAISWTYPINFVSTTAETLNKTVNSWGTWGCSATAFAARGVPGPIPALSPDPRVLSPTLSALACSPHSTPAPHLLLTFFPFFSIFPCPLTT